MAGGGMRNDLGELEVMNGFLGSYPEKLQKLARLHKL